MRFGRTNFDHSCIIRLARSMPVSLWRAKLLQQPGLAIFLRSFLSKPGCSLAGQLCRKAEHFAATSSLLCRQASLISSACLRSVQLASMVAQKRAWCTEFPKPFSTRSRLPNLKNAKTGLQVASACRVLAALQTYEFLRSFCPVSDGREALVRICSVNPLKGNHA